MNKCRKLGFAVAACGASITALHLINKKIAKTATQKNITANSDELVYEWKFGKVAYTKSGKGSLLFFCSMTCHQKLHPTNGKELKKHWQKNTRYILLTS